MSNENGETLSPRMRAWMESNLDMRGPPIEVAAKASTQDQPVVQVDANPGSLSDLVQGMLAARVPNDLIVKAISLVENVSTRHPPDANLTNAKDGMAEKRREWDREYRRRKRAEQAGLTLNTEGEKRPPDTKNSEVSIKEVVIESEEEDKKKKVRASIVYSKEFDSFWLSYPRTPSMGKFEAWKVWQKLPAEERSLASAAVPKFKAWLKTQKSDYPVVHAVRFLSKKRFDGFQEPAAPKAIDFNSEEYQAARRRALDAIKGT